MFRKAATVLAAVALSAPAGAVGRSALYDVSQEVLQAYRTLDGSKLHELLSPQLGAKYTVEALRRVLLTCRSLTGQVERFSLPTMGTRHFAFFAIYTEEAGVFDMLMEIDNEAKIAHLVISHDVTAPEQVCTISRK